MVGTAVGAVLEIASVGWGAGGKVNDGVRVSAVEGATDAGLASRAAATAASSLVAGAVTGCAGAIGGTANGACALVIGVVTPTLLLCALLGTLS